MIGSYGHGSNAEVRDIKGMRIPTVSYNLASKITSISKLHQKHI